MAKNWIAAIVAVAVAAAIAGCSKTADRTDEQGAAASGDEVSEAAASRGVATGEAEDMKEAQPRIVLETIEYEWSVSPERSLMVELGFVNPGKDVGRAKGYAFVIAGSKADPSMQGVYPWNAKITDGAPDNYESGGRLLYWDEKKLALSIPYKERAGCWDTIRILVYDNDGKVVLDETHELPITGEPTGRKAIQQTLIL